MSEVNNQHAPPKRGCVTCSGVIRQMVIQGLVHDDDRAWNLIAQHFKDDTRGLVKSSPADSRQEVLSDVMHKLYDALCRIDVYAVNHLHAYLYTAMAHARDDVLRRRSRRMRHEVLWDPEWDTPDVAGAVPYVPQPREAESNSVYRCLIALEDIRKHPGNTPLDVMSIDVIRTVFLADLNGERIDRVQACHRLGLTGEQGSISQKLARIRSAKTSLLHNVINNIDPDLFTLLERPATTKEEDD